MMENTEKIIPVHLNQNSYDIYVGTGNLTKIAEYLENCCPGYKHVAIITDENVEPLYGIPAGEILSQTGREVDICVVPAGEESKSVEMTHLLWQQLTENGLDRKSVILAVGGGVVGDLAGFVAATLFRGLRFVQVPTTLLAHVDSSVGGKVGINIPQGKNLVGAFLQPQGVFIDLHTLKTLDARQFQAGMAEVVKYGVILDAEFFAFLENNTEKINARDNSVMTSIITRCCEIKAQIVQHDERETTGERALLNFGHTYAHVIETLCGFGTILHGEAVGMGMLAATRLAVRITQKSSLPASQKHEITSDILSLYHRLENLLKKLHIPTEFPILESEKILHVMLHDKKTLNGKCRFILPQKIGSCSFQTVDDTDTIIAAIYSL
ncbi:MAG: 3-dehydroquinate synthase [Planctomycetia bacterium]|nr:3-dehydroquinate synthase [Planctomycetia bacterium]